MVGSGLLALLDDIAAILDDVSVMTKVAAEKTAGVLGDDLALNAQQVSGVQSARELPVVWAVAKGSFKNKVILVPSALALSFFLPWVILPLLILGGLYLCFEGVEKVAGKFLHHEPKDKPAHATEAVSQPREAEDFDSLEKEKIKGAVRTDFVLSAEIVVIALGTVADKPFSVQVGVLIGIGLVMTVGVYGLVAAIVKMDDAGLYLNKKSSPYARVIGRGLLLAAPKLMKSLTVIGTVAMFLVGGSIIAHGIPPLHGVVHYLADSAGSAGGWLVRIVADLLIGIVSGGLALLVVEGINKLRKPKAA